MRLNYSAIDKLIIMVDKGIKTLWVDPSHPRPSPGALAPDLPLLPLERKKSAALMRVNHSGEVCAQALYEGQAAVCRSQKTKQALLQAAEEETDHLAWCQERIKALQSHTSYANPLWYLGSLGIGILAGMINDQWSLGFVVETERQVEKHLRKHLEALPENDLKSRAILTKMCEEEAHHATVAMGAGATELPAFVKFTMQLFSKVMTTTAYYL